VASPRRVLTTEALSLPKIVWDFDPVAFATASSQFRYYSLCLVLGLSLGYLVLSRQIERGGGAREDAGEFTVYGVLGVLVGARAGHVFFYDLDHFLRDPLWGFQVWKGGLASHGAVIGLAVTLYWFVRRRAIPFLDGADRLAVAVLPGAALVRLGNLFNSEILGRPTDGSWGIRFPRYGFGGDDLYRHPTQLYEMALAVSVLVVLLIADRRLGKERRPRGVIAGLLLLTLFSGRFVVEFLKEPQPGEVAGLLNRGQLLSIPLIFAGAALVVYSLRRRLPAGWVVGGAETPIAV